MNSNLHYEESKLHWDGVCLSQLASEYGTPLYVVNSNLLKDTYRGFCDTFSSEGLAAEIFYSFKTNPIPDLLKVLVEAGAGAETVSPYELWLARQLGVPGSRIVVNGTVKPPAYLEEAVSVEAGLINVESIEELSIVREIATQRGKVANVGLRVNPALKGHRLDLTVSTGRASSPMGFIIDSEKFRTALEMLASTPNLTLKGLHCHIGSGIRTVEPYRRALATVLRLWSTLWYSGYHPEILDLGGGFNVPSLKALSLWEAVRLFGWNKAPRPPAGDRQKHLLRDVARTCEEQLRIFQEKENAPAPRLFFEPGRSLTATSQIILIQVQTIVERKKNAPYVLCDGGAMSLSPMLFSEYHEIKKVTRGDNGSSSIYNILGNMPTPLDIVAPGRRMPALAPGDVLAVMDAGAYFTSLGNTFAGPRAAIVLIEDGSSRLIRRRETYQDLVARDLNFTVDAKNTVGTTGIGH